MSTRHDRLDGFIVEFGQELTGPWLARRSIVRELRDGLHDAADAYHEAGASRADAERQALAECGRPAEVAESFRNELAAQQGRQTVWLMFALGALTFVAANLAWRSAPAGVTNVDVPSSYSVLAQAVDLLGAATFVVALLAIAGYGWAWRRIRSVGRATSAIGWSVLGISVAKLAGGAVLWFGSPPAMTLTAASVLTTALIVLTTAWLVWLAARCVALGSACRA